MRCLYHPTPKTDISNQSSTIPPQSLDLPLKPFLTEYSSQPLPFNWHQQVNGALSDVPTLESQCPLVSRHSGKFLLQQSSNKTLWCLERHLNSISGAGQILRETDFKVKRMLPLPGSLFSVWRPQVGILSQCLQLLLWGYWVMELWSLSPPWNFCALNSCIKCAALPPISALSSLIMWLFSSFLKPSPRVPTPRSTQQYCQTLQMQGGERSTSSSIPVTFFTCGFHSQ